MVSTAQQDGFSSCARAPSSLCVMLSRPTITSSLLSLASIPSADAATRSPDLPSTRLRTPGMPPTPLSPPTAPVSRPSTAGKVTFAFFLCAHRVAGSPPEGLEQPRVRGLGYERNRPVCRKWNPTRSPAPACGSAGTRQVVRKNHGNNSTIAVPSPDGLHVAILGSNWDDSIWMMENF